MKTKQKRKLFLTRCIVKDKVCNLVIDRKYWRNVASTTMVEKLKLPFLEHPTPYIIDSLEDPEFKDMGDLMVTKQVRVSFKLGEYEDEVLCDVLPTKTKDLLLGLPWRRERRAKHDSYTNKYSFLFKNSDFTLVPFDYEEVVRVKSGSESEKKKMSEKKIERKESEEKEVVEKENCERKEDGKEKNEVSIDKGESFKREEDEKSKLEKECGEHKGEFFLTH